MLLDEGSRGRMETSSDDINGYINTFYECLLGIELDELHRWAEPNVKNLMNLTYDGGMMTWSKSAAKVKAEVRKLTGDRIVERLRAHSTELAQAEKDRAEAYRNLINVLSQITGRVPAWVTSSGSKLQESFHLLQRQEKCLSKMETTAAAWGIIHDNPGRVGRGGERRVRGVALRRVARAARGP